MITHHLSEWEDEVSLGVVCIASHLEDYRLAFVLNRLLNTSFKNNASLIETSQKKKTFGFSVFISKESKNNPAAYLVDNLSVQEESPEASSALNGINPSIQGHLIKSLKKWHYLLCSEDLDWCAQTIKKLNSKDIIYYQSINYQHLKQNELDILTSIIYDD
jgi:hypothetical protein